MPIRIPDRLPARKTLESEGVMVMDSTRAARQDIRPLQIGLLNLMPNKERTETQFARLIGSTPLQVDLTLVRITEHQSKNTSEAYLKSSYSTWEDVRCSSTVSSSPAPPIANIPREVNLGRDGGDHEVEHVTTPCSSAGGAGSVAPFPRRPPLPHARQAFGVYRHKVVQPTSPFLRGFSDDLAVPVSRYNDIDRTTFGKDLRCSSTTRRSASVWGDRKRRAIYMLNHLEYDNRSLADEYDRDQKAGLDTAPPVNVTRTTTRRRSRRTAGAVTVTCCSRTGSTTFTRRRHSTSRKSARPKWHPAAR